ncbi:CAP domain-containing protein [Halovulum dunhuangense]|uniref:CAP domain-containing protein n=1 Tax=Halovulum dunhuangense TaxID=1505036 RepID=A0A849L047_9RHOB|nr:CAP domain-containing protein [Halovulum dunhuangense]NNU79150.1 CAP domain-containing protein [Halovulum dunhuangense]
MIDRRRMMIAGTALLAFGPGPAGAGVPAGILDHGNRARAAAGLAPLRASDRLNRAAQSHAEAMARAGRLSHTLGSSSPVSRARGVGYAYRSLAENIAYRTSPGRADANALAQVFVEQWMASPPHRRNLLNPALTEAGIGVAAAGGLVYAVQMLATPR